MRITPINIGCEVQLFFDNFIIEFIQALTRRMHQPAKHPANPVVKKDRPWEITPYWRTGSMCVAFDPEENLFKSWYYCYAWDYDRYFNKDGSHAGLNPPGWLETVDIRWMYAESEDGISWHKPELDYRKIDGQKTNICLGREDYGKGFIGSFFLDPLENDPVRRFKALHLYLPPDKPNEVQTRVSYSADGRTWTSEPKGVTVGDISQNVFGDEIMVLPDPPSGQYIITVREHAMAERLDVRYKTVPCRVEANWEPPFYLDNPHLMNKRRVFMTNSNSLLETPSLREMLVPDDTEDNLDDEFYCMPIIRIGDMFIGFLNVLHGVDNTMNVQLLYSRNAFDWKRVERGRPFLDVDEQSWDKYLVEIGNSVVFRDDAIYIYYGASACHHDWWMWGEKEGLDMSDTPGVSDTAMGLATLRPEGFVSIDSTVRPGLLLTRPFVSHGSQLRVNVQCEPNGNFEVELTDADDQVIPGYERSACDTFTGDAPRHVVTWGGKSQLPRAVLAKGAKLRFFSHHASIYAFQIMDKND